MGKLTISVECGPAFRENAMMALSYIAGKVSPGPTNDVLTKLAKAIRNAEWEEDRGE